MTYITKINNFESKPQFQKKKEQHVAINQTTRGSYKTTETNDPVTTQNKPYLDYTKKLHRY